MKKKYLITAFTVFATLTSIFSQNNLLKTKKFNSISSIHYKKKSNRFSPIWTDNFSNSSTWTLTDLQNGGSQNWIIGTSGPSGSFSGGMGSINSTTASNGFALFDSDAIGSGSTTQDATITINSPINCSSYPGVILNFESYYRAFQGNCYVEVSNNNGTNWTQYAIHSNIATNSATNNPENVSVDISNTAANQSSVLIRFRYTGGWDYAWMIDDVSMNAVNDNNATLDSLTIPKYVNPGNINITGRITNSGVVPINSIDVTWTDGLGATNTDNITGINIPFGSTYIFSHSSQLNVLAGESYDITVQITLPNDSDLSDNSLSMSIAGLTFNPNKITIGEEKTGEWCGWCPRGAVAMAEMANSNPNDFIGIAVHSGDPMAVSAYDANIGNYIPGGYPGAGVDRVVEGDPSTFLQMHNQRKNSLSPAEVHASGFYDGNNIYTTVSAKFAVKTSDNLRLAAVLIGDNISGSGQANFYSGGGSGTMIMPNSGSMPGYNFSSGPQVVNPFYHDHVALALGNNQINGMPGSLPNNINANDSLTYDYTFSQSSSWDMSKLHIVGMLIDPNTGEILNAGKGNLFPGSVSINDDYNNNVNLNIYPNPINENAFVSFNSPKAEKVSVDVINSIGQVVFTETLGIVNGQQQVLIDVSNLQSGIYFVKINIDNKNFTKKINIIM
jgi:hypothetical protein